MPANPPKKENICAILVTYHPDNELPKRVDALASQVAYCVIVDNTLMPDISAPVSEAAKKNKNINVIQNKKNNLANADNQGAAFARKHNYQWILTMDQDSLPAKGMVQEQINAYHLARKEGIYADVIGVNFTYKDTGETAFAKQCSHKGYFTDFKETGIQRSGSLLSLDAYQKAGPFREWFVIDYIDTEYCRRLNRKGFCGIIACKAGMIHSISKTFNFKRRWRYRIPNKLMLGIEYFFRNPRWAIKKMLYRYEKS